MAEATKVDIDIPRALETMLKDRHHTVAEAGEKADINKVGSGNTETSQGKKESQQKVGKVANSNKESPS